MAGSFPAMADTVRRLHWQRIAIVVGGAAVVFVLAYGAVTAGRAWIAWRGIERVEFDLEAAAATATPDVVNTEEAPIADEPAPLNTDYDTVLVIGSDERPEGYISDQDAAYADAVLLYLSPRDGSAPTLVSIPRDLKVTDPCTGEVTKLDRTLEACNEQISAIEHVGLAVQEFTGVAIDDVALIDFTGFVEVIDTVGGVTLCTEYALRENRALILEAGCSTVDGEQALRYLRSRRTEELVDGEWRFVENVGDATRNERQQELLLALFGKLRAMRSPADLTAVITQVDDSIQLGEGLSMAEAVSLAWDLRSRGAASIRRPVIPTETGVIDGDTFVVIATEPFLDVIGA